MHVNFGSIGYECYECYESWGVAVLELDSHAYHKKGPDYTPCPCLKNHQMYIDHSHTAWQTTNPLIAQPLSASPNCAW